MNNIKFLQKLTETGQPYFTTTDLGKILDVSQQSLSVTLNRLVKDGVLIRLKRGVYQPVFQDRKLEKVANELYYPSYLSFESALSRYGILSQTPYVLTFATSKPSKRLNLGDKEVEYRQLKKEYFFGYILENGIYVAEPEKALLDHLYMISRGLSADQISELSLIGLDKNKLIKYSRKFPSLVQSQVKELIPKLGQHSISVK